MHLRYTILYVDNVSETLDFYIKAFGFTEKMRHESGDYGELETGSTTLSFSSRKLMEQLGKSPDRPDISRPVFEIAFETENVPLALETAIKAGATLVQKVEEMPWGQTTAYVGDPNGFLIEICSSVCPISG
ncbi:VOC family protein [Kiloniella laminariae]|uniref:VOC family protein n=1 Tax=Kiloniella laminariae TaxID=454162 RepID=A0ABT4LMY9_9PROT|nr:VOC family protein [Kiloniella laminariae]MCZ4282505.1 VOC family protein [Kiloniella laminariae]